MADVRPLDETMLGETEGRRAMSWIWCVHRHDTDAEETAESMSLLAVMFSDLKYIVVALRIKWCKTRTHAHRWHEEVILVEEEMKRVKAFFAYEARTWMSRVE